MRNTLAALLLLAGSILPAQGATFVNIGVNLPSYPRLVPVPGYPVYYAPGVDSNYFFYDGLYWDFDGDRWYASSWYNGPWRDVDPLAVPVYLLRVPVRYYHRPPAYFRGWRADTAPRWGDHWGRDWERGHSGWSNWRGGASPGRAPLPAYQRNYRGDRYPGVEQQQSVHNQNSRYQPRESFAREHYGDRGDDKRGEGRAEPRGEARGPGNRGEGHGEGRGNRER
jgi:hypothetical protein